jgi:O-antigen/teichoic acid export membrane protein
VPDSEFSRQLTSASQAVVAPSPIVDPSPSVDMLGSPDGEGMVGGPGGLIARIVRWVTKGGLAVLEQGLFSGSNFLMGVLLARWMLPPQYGAYAYTYAIFLFLSLIQISIIFEPMAVFGCADYQHCLRGYQNTLLQLNTGLSIIMVVGLALYAFFTRGEPGGLSGALVGMAVAGPCVLLSWLSRRSFYLKLKPGFPVVGALIYFLCMIGGLFLLKKHGLISPFSAYIIMAAAALVASLVLFIRLHWEFKSSDAPAPNLRETWRRHWSYGRWAVAASFVAWFPAYIYFPVLNHFSGLVPAAQFRSLMNFVLPVQQTYGALSIFLLAIAAGVQGKSGVKGLRPLVKRFTVILLSGAILYWLVLIPFRHQAFQLLYGGKYMEASDLMPLIGISCILWSAVLAPTIILRALESPSDVFWAQLAASISCILFGIPMTRAFGVRGVAWGLVVSNGVAFLICMLMLRRRIAQATLAGQ